MLKVAALLLAIIIWSMINDAISNSPTPASLPEVRVTLTNLPVLVLGKSSTPGEYILKPSTVSVTVKGSSDAMRRFSASQARLYVDASNVSGKDRYRQRVQYEIYAAGVQVDRISPPAVEVELRE